jgi:cobalt-precorrin-5B (C1)-methyltransferase
MGDFVGGMLKYLRRHPVPRVTIAGGLAKMTKLAQGLLDLHSGRGRADLARLAELAHTAGAPHAAGEAIRGANTVAEAFDIALSHGANLGDAVALGAWRTAAAVLDHPGIALEIIVFDRSGRLIGRSPLTPTHH